MIQIRLLLRGISLKLWVTVYIKTKQKERAASILE
nr:MAG TPA: hypothetical protein [Caudoviricetes sp.]